MASAHTLHSQKYWPGTSKVFRCLTPKYLNTFEDLGQRVSVVALGSALIPLCGAGRGEKCHHPLSSPLLQAGTARLGPPPSRLPIVTLSGGAQRPDVGRCAAKSKLNPRLCTCPLSHALRAWREAAEIGTIP